METKVLIATTKNITSEGVVNRLSTEPTLNFLGWVTDSSELQHAYDTFKPDCLIIGITLFGDRTAEKIRAFKLKNPKAKLFLICFFVSEQFVRQMLDAGFKGIFSAPNSTYDHLVFGLKCVASNQRFLCRQATDVMLGTLFNPQDIESDSNELSKREIQIVMLIADGKSSKEIARKLSIAHTTVDVHRRNIMRKIGAHKTAEITKYAIQRRIIFV